MGLYGFKPQFEAPILAGIKRHTIRAERKVMDRPGATMHLYIGLRHKGARCIGRPTCSKVEPISIDASRHICVAGLWLDKGECEQLARCDGFSCFDEMMAFWPDEKLPFTGHIYHWRHLNA